MSINQAAFARMTAAIDLEPSIVATVDDIRDGKHLGVPLAVMLALGLTKKDLKKLQEAGFAFEARTKNIWLPGEHTPDGKQVPSDSRAVGRGSKNRYWLLAKADG